MYLLVYNMRFVFDTISYCIGIEFFFSFIELKYYNHCFIIYIISITITMKRFQTNKVVLKEREFLGFLV